MCQRIGLIRHCHASSRNSRSAFIGETLRGPWVYLPLDQRSKTTTHQKNKKNDCNISNYVPFVVLGLSRDSVFDVCRYTENPVPERSGSTSEDLLRNPLQRSTDTKNTNKNEGREEVQSDLLHDLPGWLQEFRENLVDESGPSEARGHPAPGRRDTSSSSHELPMESPAKVEPGSGKHGVHTHFPKDPFCDICLKTKIRRASCRRRAGTVVLRAENFGDLITADHKILNEESELRNNHRYAVVVQDLATQWLQSYPCKTKSSHETHKNLMKFLEPTRKAKAIPWNLASHARNYPGIIVRQHHTVQKQMGLLKEQFAG